MDRRRFVFLIGSALASPLLRAQQPGKFYRIGWLSIAPRPQIAHLIDAFERGLLDLLADDSHAKALGARARHLAETELSWTRYVDAIHAALAAAVARH